MNYTFFFHLTSPFSNFHPAKFEYKELIFISNEQFMMYSKAKNFGDEDSAEKIIAINNEPLAQKFINGKITREDIVNDKTLSDQWNKLMIKVKKLGRGVQNYDESYWNSRRYKIVLFGARLKFTQNEDLKKILMNTGDTTMVEASRFDPIWSCGLTEYDAKRTPPEKWPGLNLLGKVLNELKSEFTIDFNQKQIIENNLKEQQEIFLKTEVLNFYKIGKIVNDDSLYIGRYNKSFNLTKSKFSNPFPVKNNSEEERDRVIFEYQNWLWQEIANNNITKNDILSLNGKKLICYCNPKKCHGDILKETLELLINNEESFDKKVKELQSIKNKMKS